MAEDIDFEKEIRPNAVYTTAETEQLLKVSRSTMKRLLKRGILKANKVGGQYRILGKEILKLVSPAAGQKAKKTYLSLKDRVKSKINKW